MTTKLSDKPKCGTDIVLLINNISGKERSVSRLYAVRKKKQHSTTYSIKEI